MHSRWFREALLMFAGFGAVAQAQWIPCGGGSTTCAVGTNVGIGTYYPKAPLDMAALSYKLSPATASLEFSPQFVPDGMANQKVDVVLTSSEQGLWGTFDVSIADSYSYLLAAGVLTKRFYVGVNPGGAIFINESRVIDAGGATADSYAISDLSWDGAHYKFSIIHRNSRQNVPVVRMTAFMRDSSPANFLTFTPTLMMPAGMDTTLVPKQLIEYRNSGNQTLLAAGTSAAPTIGLLAQPSLGMNFPGGGNAVAFTSATGAEMARISSPGTLSIGTQTATCGAAAAACRLVVAGAARAQEVVVDTGWSDYVFAPGYRLVPLADVAAYVKQNQHLPGIPSAAEVAEKGVSLGDMQSKLLAKIEELTLHMIEAEKENVRVRAEADELRARIVRLEKKK